MLRLDLGFCLSVFALKILCRGHVACHTTLNNFFEDGLLDHSGLGVTRHAMVRVLGWALVPPVSVCLDGMEGGGGLERAPWHVHRPENMSLPSYFLQILTEFTIFVGLCLCQVLE